MSNVLRLALVDPNDTTRESMKSMLLDMDMVWLEAECSRYEFFADVVAQTTPDIGLISLDADDEKAMALIQRLSRETPDCAILVCSSSNDGNLILRTIRAGAKEFLTHPVKLEDLLTAINRINERRTTGTEGQSRSSHIIAVAGTTGGVGTTSIAVNLGCALAADEANSVVLVDLDLCLGDADVLLDTIPDYTLTDVAENVGRLDFSLLKKSLTKHDSGLFLLPRPAQLEEISVVTPDDMRKVLGLLKACFTHVILDISKGYSKVDLAALETAQEILLVLQLDLPCLRNTVRLLMSFNEMGDLGEKTKVIVNRSSLDSAHITVKKAEEIVGKPIYWQLPNDYRIMIEARNNGVPLLEQAPKAAITHSLGALAKALTSERDVTQAEMEGRHGGIGRFFRFLSPTTNEKK